MYRVARLQNFFQLIPIRHFPVCSPHGRSLLKIYGLLQGRLFQGLDKFLFSQAVPVNIIGELPGQRPLQAGVLLMGLPVGAEVVPHCQVTGDAGPVRPGEDVELVGPLVPALPQIAAARDAELLQILIPHRLKGRGGPVHRLQVFHHRHDVQNGLGRQTGDGGAPDVVNGGAVVPQHGPDSGRLGLKLPGPVRVIVHYGDMLGHGRRLLTNVVCALRAERQNGGTPPRGPRYPPPACPPAAPGATGDRRWAGSGGRCPR